MFVEKKAYAKINLTLEILDKRDDGYHNIRSVMQKVSLYDIVDFELSDSGIISLECDKYVCDEKDNLAYKAAALYSKKYFENTGKRIGAEIKIHKKIPDKAGLAGGSADCACVLDCLYEHFGGIDYQAVEAIAACLGSDINFCLENYRCALCTDRGINLQKCAPLRCENILICVPDFSMKTSEIYSAFDFSPVYFSGNPSEKVLKALSAGDYGELYKNIVNAFSPICEKKCRDIAEIKNIMFSCGAHVSQMSGSGSAVFGMFGNSAEMQKCNDILSKKYKKCFMCFSVVE